MPWDGSDLWQARFDASGGAHGPSSTSRAAREWTIGPVVVARRRPPFRRRAVGLAAAVPSRRRPDELLTPIDAEFGEPDWQFGQPTYGFAADGSIWAVGRSNGRDAL